MPKNIDMVGGLKNAKEIVKYHSQYFKNYQWYDSVKKCFLYTKPLSNEGIVFVKFLIGEVRKEPNNESS